MNLFEPVKSPEKGQQPAALCDFCGTIHENPLSTQGAEKAELPTDRTAPFLTRAEVRILALLSAQGLRNGWAAIAANGGHVDNAQGEALDVLLSLSIKLNRLASDMKNGNTSGLFRTPF